MQWQALDQLGMAFAGAVYHVMARGDRVSEHFDCDAEALKERVARDSLPRRS
jgi:hypothetical protein